MIEHHIALRRFGYGAGPRAAPRPPETLLQELRGPDPLSGPEPLSGPLASSDPLSGPAEDRSAMLDTQALLALSRGIQLANRARRRGEPGAEEQAAALRTRRDDAIEAGARATLARALDGQPLRERLVRFWADHFTISGADPMLRAGIPAFVHEAIRPHVAGRFADMLKAVARHPLMLIALDQFRSAGPESRVGVRYGRGLNENFARELLELHTLGADGGYSQQDVRETALLLAGLGLDWDKGFLFRPALAEPAPRRILGTVYREDGRTRIDHVDTFLEDLATHPVTARHIARKLVAHFVSPEPDPGMVADLAVVFEATGGDLEAVATALLRHPFGRDPRGLKARTPVEFTLAAFTALGLTGSDLQAMPRDDFRRDVIRALARMGQPYLRPPGPDGWSEDPAHWITPQGLAARISWAAAQAARHQGRAGDPRDFLGRTLGPLADASLTFAVSAAETRQDGVALVLASAAFNRR